MEFVAGICLFAVSVAVKKVLSLCDGLSAIDDIRNGVLCSLVPDFVSMLQVLTGPFAQQQATARVTVCFYTLIIIKLDVLHLA